MACQIGGRKFLMDLFSSDQIHQEALSYGDDKKHDFVMSI